MKLFGSRLSAEVVGVVPTDCGDKTGVMDSTEGPAVEPTWWRIDFALGVTLFLRTPSRRLN